MAFMLRHVLESMVLLAFSQVIIHYERFEVIMENLFSVEEAARRLGGVSKWTVHAWLSQGKLLRTKVGGRTMIRESELQKVVKDGGKSPAPRQPTRI